MTADRNLNVGIMLPTAIPRDMALNPGLVASTAEWAEKHGFDSVWVGDHIFHPLQFMESLVSLSFAAARTRTIQIGTCVFLLPMRQLSIAASQLSTLSVLSGGRFNLGIGVGGEWPDEWTAAGVALKDRGARLDEALPLLRRLFAGETVTFEGRFNTLPGVALRPIPPRIPLYLAGRAPAALERAALHGDGWIGFFLTLNGFKRDRAKIREMRERAGRPPVPFKYGMLLSVCFDQNGDDADLRAALKMNAGFPPESVLTPLETLRRFVIAGTPAGVTEKLQEYIDAGCETLCVSFINRQEAGQEDLRIFASEVLPRLKKTSSCGP